MKRIDLVFAWIILALGVIHICATPFVYSGLSQSAVWFAGAGLAAVFAGMLNLLRVRHADTLPSLRTYSLASNLLLFAWIVAGMISMHGEIYRNPQAFVLFVAALGETLFSAHKGQ
jgi:hypothetical protein